MSTALRQPTATQEFLAWEARQELRYEFDGWQPVAMTGGTIEHALVQSNLIAALNQRLRGHPCKAIGSELKIRVADSIRYPDAFVVCPPVERGATVLDDPVVVFEILSESTAVTDRATKNREYRDTPSIQRHVMLEQLAQAATVFERSGGDWIGHLRADQDQLHMPEIGIVLPLAELYDGVSFPDAVAGNAG